MQELSTRVRVVDELDRTPLVGDDANDRVPIDCPIRRAAHDDVDAFHTKEKSLGLPATDRDRTQSAITKPESEMMGPSGLVVLGVVDPGERRHVLEPALDDRRDARGEAIAPAVLGDSVLLVDGPHG